jgi:predicted amidophosphoribosyltransferase
MERNLQQQCQTIKKETQASHDIQSATQNVSLETSICPNCRAELPEEALFCPECGLPMKQHVCPKCGAPASPTADICEVCGAWLLEGKCKFCYADLSSVDAMFCPECGKPRDGIHCPNCGTLSIFDFCPKCGEPVTEEAVADLQLARKGKIAAPEAAKKTFSTQQEARRWHNAHRPGAQTDEIKAELAQLEALINSKPEPEVVKTETPVSVKKPFFSERQMNSIRKTGAIVDEITRQRIEAERIAEEKRKAEEAERKRKEEERRRQIEEAERKRKEEERRRQIREAQERKEALERQLRGRGWRCNAYNVTHPGGPNECSAPSGGGQWV